MPGKYPQKERNMKVKRAIPFICILLMVVVSITLTGLSEMKSYASAGKDNSDLQSLEKATIKGVKIHKGQKQEDMLNALGAPDEAWVGSTAKTFRYQYKDKEYIYDIITKDGIIRYISRSGISKTKK
jgi:hypothetical protein